jgi:hypothetical protein
MFTGRESLAVIFDGIKKKIGVEKMKKLIFAMIFIVSSEGTAKAQDWSEFGRTFSERNSSSLKSASKNGKFNLVKGAI